MTLSGRAIADIFIWSRIPSPLVLVFFFFFPNNFFISLADEIGLQLYLGVPAVAATNAG